MLINSIFLTAELPRLCNQQRRGTHYQSNLSSVSLISKIFMQIFNQCVISKLNKLIYQFD